MEDDRWLMIYHCGPMHNDRSLMVHEGCTMNYNRSPMYYDVRSMVNFGRGMIDYWWTLY
jgi:hypothetical protein